MLLKYLGTCKLAHVQLMTHILFVAKDRKNGHIQAREDAIWNHIGYQGVMTSSTWAAHLQVFIQSQPLGTVKL